MRNRRTITGTATTIMATTIIMVIHTTATIITTDGWTFMATLDPETERRCRDSFAHQQAITTIGASVLSVAAGEVELVMPFSERFTQQHGFVHAGIITMLCDTACGFAALSLMPDDAAVLTTEFKVNLLSPARGERFIANGRVVRPGKKLMVCLGEVFAEEAGRRKQIALMTASMMVMDTSTGLRD
jgi:uncharacterized protein (TIGR00369 family)